VVSVVDWWVYCSSSVHVRSHIAQHACYCAAIFGLSYAAGALCLARCSVASPKKAPTSHRKVAASPRKVPTSRWTGRPAAIHVRTTLLLLLHSCPTCVARGLSMQHTFLRPGHGRQ
jgi:hypothetical protein